MARMATAIASIAAIVNLAIAFPPEHCFNVEMHITEVGDNVSLHSFDIPEVEEREIIVGPRYYSGNLCVRYRGPPATEIKLHTDSPSHVLGLPMFPQGVPLVDGIHMENYTIKNQEFHVLVTKRPFDQKSTMQFFV